MTYSLYQMYIYQFQGTFPFLYSNNQTINIKEGIDSYYLKFNIRYYQNETLIIINEPLLYIFLDKCSSDNKELICTIDKSELEEIPLRLIKPKVYYPSSLDTEQLLPLPMIGEIILNYTLSKIDLEIKIIKLLENHCDQNNYFAYEVETNVTNISSLVSEKFQLDFIDNNEIIQADCFFKKANENPMYLLCMLEKGNYSLYEIKEEIKLLSILKEKSN